MQFFAWFVRESVLYFISVFKLNIICFQKYDQFVSWLCSVHGLVYSAIFLDKVIIIKEWSEDNSKQDSALKYSLGIPLTVAKFIRNFPFISWRVGGCSCWNNFQVQVLNCLVSSRSLNCVLFDHGHVWRYNLLMQ